MKYLLARIVSVLVVLSPAIKSAVAQDITYNKPTYIDNRLDWCQTWGTNCGKPAADAFCNRQRFARARVFRAEVVGKSAATRLIGSREICSNQDFCTAFAYITCEERIPSERVFVNPVWKDQRLDACVQWATNCGKPAADAFCKSKGFSESFEAELDAQPGYAPTRLIGTDQICKESFCTGFQQIICK
jgi:hypothetical protein